MHIDTFDLIQVNKTVEKSVLTKFLSNIKILLKVKKKYCNKNIMAVLWCQKISILINCLQWQLKLISSVTDLSTECFGIYNTKLRNNRKNSSTNCKKILD